MCLTTRVCALLQVFRPPNPWTMAIMSVLSQLHAVPDLKVSSAGLIGSTLQYAYCLFFSSQLNLKFEIEVLCKHIAVEIADIRPSKLLEDAERAKSLNQLSSPKGMNETRPLLCSL